MNRVVVVGGFTEGKMALEPVAEAAVTLGLGDDAEVFVFREAMDNPKAVSRAIHGYKTSVLAHSAGIMAVTNGAQPEYLISYNGPEPRSTAQLIASALRKTRHHSVRAMTGPDRAGHARTLATNSTELLLHPYGNLRRMKAIGGFSTLAHLTDAASGGLRCSSVTMEDDELFSVCAVDPSAFPDNVTVSVLKGRHDDLLVRPYEILSATLPLPEARESHG